MIHQKIPFRETLLCIFHRKGKWNLDGQITCWRLHDQSLKILCHAVLPDIPLSPPLSTRNPTKWEVGDIQEPTGQRGTHGASAPSVQALALISLRTRKQSMFHDLSRTTTLALLTLADTWGFCLGWDTLATYPWPLLLLLWRMMRVTKWPVLPEWCLCTLLVALGGMTP